MPLIQRKAKMNDFRVASMTRGHKIGVNDAYRGTLVNSYSNIGSHLREMGRNESDSVFVYHVEKKRMKFTQQKVKTGGKGADVVMKTKSTKVRDTEWTIRIFKIPTARVKSVKQHARHFELVLK